MSNENIIKLNIGGTIFQTSKSTLTRFDGFFKTMLETEVPITKDASDAIFIDRSAKHFDSILNYMRDGKIALPESSKELKDLQKEAVYYLLEHLIDMCDSELGKRGREEAKLIAKDFNVVETESDYFQLIAEPKIPTLIIYYSVGNLKIDNSRIMSTENIVKLDVGGTIFKTSKSTLTKFDGFFKTMLEIDIPITKDESGAIFIDRSAKHFDSILNYMRDGEIELPDSPKELKNLQKEAQYYLLDGLDELCDTELEKRAKEEEKLITKDFNVIETESDYFQLIAKPKTPIFIFYYCVGKYGRAIKSQNLDLESFMKKYKDRFDIYFRPYKNNDVDMDCSWKWSLHYSNYYQYCNAGPVIGDRTFEFRLEDSVQNFFKISKMK